MLKFRNEETFLYWEYSLYLWNIFCSSSKQMCWAKLYPGMERQVKKKKKKSVRISSATSRWENSEGGALGVRARLLIHLVSFSQIKSVLTMIIIGMWCPCLYFDPQAFLTYIACWSCWGEVMGEQLGGKQQHVKFNSPQQEMLFSQGVFLLLWSSYTCLYCLWFCQEN